MYITIISFPLICLSLTLLVELDIVIKSQSNRNYHLCKLTKLELAELLFKIWFAQCQHQSKLHSGNKRKATRRAALPSSEVLITSEATLIELRQMLQRFEAKTQTYISYKDINIQFLHFQGQKWTVRSTFCFILSDINLQSVGFKSSALLTLGSGYFGLTC